MLRLLLLVIDLNGRLNMPGTRNGFHGRRLNSVGVLCVDHEFGFRGNCGRRSQLLLLLLVLNGLVLLTLPAKLLQILSLLLLLVDYLLRDVHGVERRVVSLALLLTFHVAEQILLLVH